MAEGSISQEELNNLFGSGELEELPAEPDHIWLVKGEYSVIGGRNFSLWAAQNLLAKVQKEHPGRVFKIIQVR